MADIKERKDFKTDAEYNQYLRETYGQHISHRTSWIKIAQKPLEELGGKNIIQYLNSRKDIKNPSMFLASMFEENLAKRINEGSIGRYNDDKTGYNISGDKNYPYSGFYDFGLDTAGTSVDKFIDKGYLPKDIKERMITSSVGNEKGEEVLTADFKDFKDVIDFKLAYLKEAEQNIDSYIKKNNIKVSPEAKEYFTYVGYNAGLGNAQKMLNSFNERGYLKDDAFLKDGFEPEYWKDPYKYSMRRYQGSKMLQNELDFNQVAPIQRVKENPIQAPERLNPFDLALNNAFLQRQEVQPIIAPQRTIDTSINTPDMNLKINGKLNRYQYKPDNVNRDLPSNIMNYGTTGIQNKSVSTFQDPLIELFNPVISIPEKPVNTKNTSVLPTRRSGDRPIAQPQEQFSFGGLFGQGLTAGTASGGLGMATGLVSGLIPTTKSDGTTSRGGSIASGALSGLGAGAALGPIGMAAGAVLGGLSGLLSANKAKKQEAEAMQAEKDTMTASTMSNLNSIFSNGSNLPMAYGGNLGAMSALPIGSYSHFANGGTHESNPYGGIPQGHNSQGQLRTVEEGEGKFKFKDGDYIFSNRLKFE